MKKYITAFINIPVTFVTNTLTKQQKELTEIRYFVYNEIEKRTKEGEHKYDLFYELGDSLGYSEIAIRKMYEVTKKRLKE